MRSRGASPHSRIAAALVAAAALTSAAFGQARGDGRAVTVNPCVGPGSGHLLCPNLKIGPPAYLYVERAGGGRVLLRATSDVESRGRGPIELRGRRDGWHSMSVHQRIYRVGGGHLDFATNAHLHFTNVGSYFGAASGRCTSSPSSSCGGLTGGTG